MQHFPYWRLSAYYFAYFAFLGVFAPYFGLYLQSLSLSAWDIGLLMSQMQLMRVIGPYLWGALADRLGARLLIVRVTAMVALCLFPAFFFLHRFDGLLLVMTAFAFFTAAALPLVEGLTLDHLRDNSAGYSRVRLWGSVGYIISVTAAGILLDRMGLTSLLWICIVSLAGILLSSLFVPDTRLHLPAEETSPVGEILRQPSVRALLAACFAMAVAHSTLNIFYAILLAGHGYSKSAVGALFSLGVVAEIAVFLLMPRVMRRFSLRVILLTCFAAAVVRFAMIGWGVDLLAVLALAQVLHSVTYGACHSAAIAAINRCFPGRARSRGQALYAGVSFGAGGLAGGLLSGWTWDWLGGELTFVLASFYALIGLLLVAGWIKEKGVGEEQGTRVVDTAGVV